VVLKTLTPKDLDKISDHEDSIVKSFKGKMNSFNAEGLGMFENDEMVGFLVTKGAKTKGWINLEGIYVLRKHRGKGYGEKLMDVYFHMIEDSNLYDKGRISSEPSAVKFYEKLGIKFFCKQKTGTYLSVFEIKDGKPDCSIQNDEHFMEYFFKTNLTRGGCYEKLN
jgi:ribosomal protein S18 acetylase RimI-like enzyme